MKDIDWIEELKDYHKFLMWDEQELTDYDNMTQEYAKRALKEDLEFIIGTNGYSELYEREIEYVKLLNIGEEE